MSLIRFETALEVFETFPDLQDAIAIKGNEKPPLTFLADLLASPTPEDAITFLAHILPRRYAVYWACGCVRALDGGKEIDAHEAMQAALNWLRQPEEANRRHCLFIGMQADRKEATTWLSLAAAWSGGSIAPQSSQADVAAPSHLTALAAKAAVLIALAKVGSAARAEQLGRVLDHGKKLATGGDRPS